MTASDETSLRGMALLTHVGDDDLAELSQACSWKRYGAHEQIIDQQSDTTDVFWVVEGKVRVANYSVTGREITLTDVDAGGNFGELAAIDGCPRSASVTALEDCLIAGLPQERFHRLLETDPKVALQLLGNLASIIRSSTHRIMDLSTLAANNRVQAELLRAARATGVDEDANEAEISPIPVHGDIASRVSTTRETVARVLSDLSKKGIIERQKSRLLIKDMGRLQELVEEVGGEV